MLHVFWSQLIAIPVNKTATNSWPGSRPLSHEINKKICNSLMIQICYKSSYTIWFENRTGSYFCHHYVAGSYHIISGYSGLHGITYRQKRLNILYLHVCTYICIFYACLCICICICIYIFISLMESNVTYNIYFLFVLFCLIRIQYAYCLFFPRAQTPSKFVAGKPFPPFMTHAPHTCHDARRNR